MKLQKFVEILDEKGLLVKINKSVNVEYEIPTIMKMMDGKPLLFENVEGYDMRIVANLCSSRELVALGLEIDKKEMIGLLNKAIENPKESELIENNEYKDIGNDLTKLPILRYYPSDGGSYIASGIIVANDEKYGLNASYHRIMIIEKDKIVMRILQRDFDEYIKRGLKEFAICIGNPIPIIISAALSVDIAINELSIANALSETKVFELDGHTVPKSEIIMIVEVTDEMHDEGPFLDLTETPDIVRSQRVFKIKKIYLRENSVFHTLLPGGLEHKILMGMPREPTIFREVNKVVECKDVYITPGGCSWLHCAVSIVKKDADDGKKAINAAFNGHKSMKHVFVVDDDIDIHNPNEIEWAMATRFQGDRDLIIKRNEKGSSLDPSSNQETRETTKIGFDLTMPFDRNKEGFKKLKLPMKIDLDEYLK